MTTTTSFEGLVELLEKTTNPFELSRRMPDVVAGLQNLRDRFRTVEESRIKDMYRMQELEALTAQEKQELASIAKDRTDLQQRLAKLEQRLDAMEAEEDEPVTPVYPKATQSETLAQTLGLTAKTPAPGAPAIAT